MTKIRVALKKYYEKALSLLGSSFYHDPLMISLMVLFALMLTAMLLMLVFRVEPASTQVPLTYNILYGVTYSSTWYGIYAYLIGLAVIGALDFLIAWAYFDKERLISYLMACITILLATLTILNTYNLTALAR